MCKDCLQEKLPDRGGVCLESGSYLLNYKGCNKCQSLGQLKETERIEKSDEDDEDDEETITYKHICSNCGHVVAVHNYTFSVADGYQEYSMSCLLCGRGESSHSILPDDPRKAAVLF